MHSNRPNNAGCSNYRKSGHLGPWNYFGSQNDVGFKHSLVVFVRTSYYSCSYLRLEGLPLEVFPIPQIMQFVDKKCDIIVLFQTIWHMI